MKKFFKGFVRGLGYFLLLAVILVFVPDNLANSFTLLVWIISVSLVVYLRNKHKFPYAWVAVSLFTGALLIPFMMGAIETTRNKDNETL